MESQKLSDGSYSFCQNGFLIIPTPTLLPKLLSLKTNLQVAADSEFSCNIIMWAKPKQLSLRTNYNSCSDIKILSCKTTNGKERQKNQKAAFLLIVKMQNLISSKEEN